MTQRPTSLDQLLREWPYEFGEVVARWAHGADGRPVLQMRIDLGVLQMEVEGRPDGNRPEGAESYCALIARYEQKRGKQPWILDAQQCAEVDREFVQFYHRRVAWLALHEFRRAQADADHTLLLMDRSAAHSPTEEWVEAHEQYRPFVLFHRTQAAALAELEESAPDLALREIDAGRRLIASLESQEEGLSESDPASPSGGRRFQAGEDLTEEAEGPSEFLQKLAALRDSILSEYGLDPSLEEQLSEAIAKEQYERAAVLRDQISAQQRS
ncbi:UvrB/UvrC motif-containing protein [Botrimarina hoheduenensis]|uniref:UvrB/uvrC motif protein n=1 Tax=Botrimarina hoheduenensis TaxID=2528000 RepID=A0A5C5WDM2_9BACT|nr:UvrB/UvrC motif-containing protein [Botrimarina hoheduenensis]TWT48794.1 UvrB/uvrC motif protein [Botrimarina hoheduenensis]